MLLITLLTLLTPGRSWGVEITPFHTFNQSPLIQIFGLPAIEGGTLAGRGRMSVLVAADLASNHGIDKTDTEDITLDGETYRATLAVRYGIAPRWEVGFDLPWIVETGGFLDGFVSSFHDLFKIPQNGRDEIPKDRLLYTYSRNGTRLFQVDEPNDGVGDLRLTTAYQLYHDPEDSRSSIALRAALKLPTGDSAMLHGSGGTDCALWITGSDTYDVGEGRISLFGAAGGVVTAKGDVLSHMRRQVAGFGSIGLGWSPVDWFVLKSQFYAHSPFYRNSSLHELGITTLQWLGGVTFGITGNTALDIGVSEDILVVGTSPDVAFHLALRSSF
ncbi:DUF3187 family protein [Geobacter sp. DSM 9736]|uniref:DUF3187 family protein n=1 Tax=Geobacter sp. DSM 9736 TaxID=1277350 RepID=UPI0012FDB7A7|nr:DUF3187 family protein [Geobacter sp. DSM 9736]